MNNKLNSLLIAATLALSVAAYGQNRLRADIPFEFRTAAGVQASGEYAIMAATQDGSVMKLINVQTGKSALVGMATQDGTSAGAPRLTFRCGDRSGCVLAGVTTSDGRGWSIKTPRMKSPEVDHVAVVYLQSHPGE